MKKIRIHHSYLKEIAEEIGCTTQSVRMSLEYVFNSDQAKKIRAKAKELLLKEADSIKDSEPTYKQLRYYYDCTVGLHCIDRHPDEVDLNWIRRNAFRLEEIDVAEKVPQSR